MENDENKIMPAGFDKIIDLLGVLVIIFLWIFAIYSYINLQEYIPVHYNASGGVTKWGHKTTLLFFPITATVIFIGLTLVNRHPEYFNTINWKSENALQQLTYSMRMLRVLKLSIALAFCLIIAYSYLVADGLPSPFGPWLLPVILAVILLPVGYYVVKLFKLV